MILNIRQQTLLIAILPMLLAVIALDGYFLHSRFSSMEAVLSERATLLARQIGASGEYALFSGNVEQMQKEVVAALKLKEVDFVLIQDDSGKAIAQAGKTMTDAENDVIKAHVSNGVFFETEDFLWVREPVAALTLDLNEIDALNRESAPRALGYVFVKISKSSFQKEKLELLLASLLISAVLLGFTIFFVLRFSRSIVNPIAELNNLVRRIGEGELEIHLAHIPSIIEMKELAQGVDAMAKQLLSDRLEMEQQTELLRAGEERLNEIIGTMPVSLFIKDAQSRIILMNNACEAQWGMLFSSLRDTDGSGYFPPEQMAAFLKNDRDVFAGRKMVNGEELVWNAELKMNRVLHTFKKPIYDSSAKPRYLIGLSVDITERKQAESALKRLNEQLEARIETATKALRQKKDEAEKANFDKSRFLAAASHDLRQPMHALGLFVGELQAKLTTTEQRKLVGKVEESVDALSVLLDALLDISKLDAGVVTPKISDFPITALLNRIAHDYIPLAESKGIAMRVVPNSTILHSDPVLLERVLVNFVGNAIRYTPSGGSVMVSCRYRGEKLRIEVRDNGIGIPVREQQNIFKEFVQLQNMERDRGKGLGLGLAIVDRVAKLLNHEISLASAPDKGSTFAISVPISEEAQPQAQLRENEEFSLQRAPREFENLHVLVIDDDALVRKSTQGIIESWGGKVTLAASAIEVKEMYGTSECELVICDCRLPDGNGVELIDWMKAQFKTPPQFILISGDTSPEVLQMVNERQIQLLHKPVRPAKLRSLIQFLLTRQAVEN